MPLFGELDSEELERLAGLSQVLKLPRKKMLFSEREPYRGMFVVLEGLAVVYKLSGEGRMLILHVCRPGDTLAEVPLFEEGSSTSDTTKPVVPQAASSRLMMVVT